MDEKTEKTLIELQDRIQAYLKSEDQDYINATDLLHDVLADIQFLILTNAL